MADIFISYSTVERELAAALARDLEAQGYTVWWDTQLYAGQGFTTAIQEAIRGAKAAVVIWTPTSIKSDWVLAEAQLAAVLGKLVPVRIAALDTAYIPLPFNTLHTELLTERERIYRAVAEFVAIAKQVQGTANVVVQITQEATAEADSQRDRDNGGAAATHWEFARESGDAREVRHFMVCFPKNRKMADAFKLLEELEWRDLMAEPSFARVARFVREFPSSERNIEARDWQDWLRASEEDALPAYEDYLDDWPQGIHFAKAQKALHRFRTARLIRSFTGHSSTVLSVAFSPDGRFALSGSDDKTLKLWDVASAKELRSFTGHSDTVRSVRFSPNGRFALSGSQDNTLKLWDVGAGKVLRSFAGHASTVYSVAFSANVRFALSGSGDTTLKLWEVGTGKELRSFAGHSGVVFSVAFSPDGRFALSGGDDKTLKLWEVGTGKALRSFAGHSGVVRSVVLSPDGGFVLSGSHDRTLRLWDVGTGKELRSFAGHSERAFSVALSPDGRFALSGSEDKTLKLWDVSTGKELRSFVGHLDAVRSVAFSPDGRFALSGSGDSTLKLWDLRGFG